MKFKRLKDNKPAYTKGRVYNVVEETCEYTGGSLLGFKIENDIGSQCYYSTFGYFNVKAFNELWKEVE